MYAKCDLMFEMSNSKPFPSLMYILIYFFRISCWLIHLNGLNDTFLSSFFLWNGA